MSQYHKINTVFKRDQRGHIIYGEWSTPELKYLQNLSWEFTEKIDGTNIRVMWDGANISFGGKTDRAEIQSGLIDTLTLATQVRNAPPENSQQRDRPRLRSGVFGEMNE